MAWDAFSLRKLKKNYSRIFTTSLTSKKKYLLIGNKKAAYVSRTCALTVALAFWTLSWRNSSSSSSSRSRRLVCACPATLAPSVKHWSVSLTVGVETAARVVWSAAYCSCPPGFYGRRCDVELDDDFCRRADAVDIDVILCRVWRERGYCSFAYSYDYVPVPVFCAATCELCQRGNQSDATKDSMLVAVKKRLSE